MRKVNKTHVENSTEEEKRVINNIVYDSYSQTTPLWQLTVSEFAQLMREVFRELYPSERNSARDPPRLVHGLDGLCELIGCSKSTAMRVKKSGILDEAIIQKNRKIIIDAEKALKILSNLNYAHDEQK